MWVEYVILKYKLYGTIIIFTKTSILYYLLWILQLSLLKYDDDCQMDQSSIVPLIDGGSEGKPTGISISTSWGHYMYNMGRPFFSVPSLYMEYYRTP